MNVSTFWDFENNKGEIIVHNKKELLTNYISPAESMEEFEDWSKKSLQYIKLT
ncbi:hypothetical protein [Shouchella clausii]|uniref:hypothetical protein n=1 Tax=Shouchella clausii TaxID=79880 RepID=UPI001C527784|nr:hypothetical protein [Shouchella clausii]